MYIGGAWLHAAEGGGQGTRWMEIGKRQLEERAARLISDDGGFSMYSVTYHREFLDAMSMAEVWRRSHGLPEFSTRYRRRLASAATWLAECVHPGSGDAPNIGANDGTRLLPLTDTGYRDFRPSVQLACALFCNARAYPREGEWNGPLAWFGIPLPDAAIPTFESRVSSESGFAFLKSPFEDAQVFLRYPHYRFRPSHADPLHIDLWVGGKNVLRGPGSYRYASAPEWLNYFSGVGAHNTAQFDHSEAMPRIGRFLFGDWLRCLNPPSLLSSEGDLRFTATALHAKGQTHRREAILGRGRLIVVDTLSGFHECAVVRWRLMPGAWQILENSVRGEGILVAMDADQPFSARLVDGWEARCYGSKSPVPVIEVEFRRPARLVTRIEWNWA